MSEAMPRFGVKSTVARAAILTRNDRGREKENSKLTVKDIDTKEISFQEETETYDISDTGISFFLKTPVWVDTHLNIDIASSNAFGAHHTVRAKVVRLKVDSSKKQFVAARFD